MLEMKTKLINARIYARAFADNAPLDAGYENPFTRKK
jgi:hypothetical protein